MSRTDRAIQKLSDETDRLRELNSSLVKNEHELTNSEMMQLGESGPWQEHYSRQLAKR